KSKPKLLEIDLRCLKAGYDGAQKVLELETPDSVPETMIMDGNKAIALGAIHGGCRAYYAYPMSPASSILNHMAHYANKTGMLVKQVEDEISTVNMALGSMLMGTRALTATSGGGFALMTETVSLSGMIECPLVVVIAQRPGPATGMPTWTCQSDLNLAIHSGHGEFPRCVIGCSDPDSCFDLTQHAFNIAEKFQSPVIVLTEKGIAETNWTIPMFEQRVIPIERGLVPEKELGSLENEDRYRITDSGLSKRWNPGTSDAYYFANSDEHLEDGSLTEEAAESKAMIDKRNRKMDLILDYIPDPDIYGEPSAADISFVGWGSSKNVMLDIIEEYAERGKKVNFLHFSYLWPLKTEVAEKFFSKNKNVCLIEGNKNGQFGEILENGIGVKFADRLLKYD
ncbi:MAG: 2-oxoacid:acceptor oxidoreductase subunit alpha, partial [bacterium]|nr:2-oxoacid:acceptor oxidoreductase subunit alpha [bacterium]